MNQRIFQIFLDVQRGLPRQGPGDDKSTRDALSLVGNLPDDPWILDVGCGPGAQTLTLATALGGHVTAVDNNDEYLEELKTLAEVADVAERIEIVAADMGDMPFHPGVFDLIWSEAAAYSMGTEKALINWKRFLKPRGYLGISELVWLRRNPPLEVVEFFSSEYPSMTDVEEFSSTTEACGYELLGILTLPEAAWWVHYYTPLEAKLPALREKYAGDDEALAVIEATRREIEIRRLYHEWYGYAFFIARVKSGS